MRIIIVTISMLIMIVVSCADGEKGLDEIRKQKTPTEYLDRISYILGFDLGQQLKMDSMDSHINYYIMGMLEAIEKDSSRFSKHYSDSVRMAFIDAVQKKQMEMERERQDQDMTEMKNLTDSLDEIQKGFLEKNKAKPGVVTLDDGLQYEVLREGDGPIPNDSQYVKVHFRATFVNGKEFDNTYSYQPAEIPVNAPGVLKGWTEAWKRMKVGSKWRIVIPPELGLGAKGAPPRIPPNAILIFEMELLDVLDAPTQQMPPGNPPPAPPN